MDSISRSMIDAIDNLKIFVIQHDLPNIVVIGDQNSGKSSIIEAISGIELPRGKGIVTHPLKLQLRRVINLPWKATLTYRDDEANKERIEITEPHVVADFIREAQVKMCSPNEDVSYNFITLRVESPAETAPDLTLIDLPSITRIVLKGQALDIYEHIERTIMDHISNKNTLILCVVPANLDVTKNQSFNIAKQVDPHGIRTLGVITKPDTVDEAHKSDVLALLNNEKIQLDKGFHVVKCRSQKDLDNNLTLEESLENETIYFQTDRYYRTIDKSKVGTFNLANRITEELVAVIQSTLPRLRHQIRKSLKKTEEKMATLPNGISEDEMGEWLYLNRRIYEMNAEIKMNLFKGRRSNCQVNLFAIWRTNFNNFKTNIDGMKDRAMKVKFTMKKLKNEISEMRGNEISGFLNFELFETMIRSQIFSYKTEAHSLLEEMCADTMNIINETIHHFFDHVPRIELDLQHLTILGLKYFNDKAWERIQLIFEGEKMIFTSDTEFEDEMEKTEDESTIAGIKLRRTIEEDAIRMANIIECYLKIVHTRLADIIPRSIRQCLHVELSEDLKERFFQYAESEIHGKVNENKFVSEQRKYLQTKIEGLEKAKDELAKL